VRNVRQAKAPLLRDLLRNSVDVDNGTPRSWLPVGPLLAGS
jgi:hypothetical protein